MVVLEKKKKMFVENLSFVEICDMLDYEEKRFLNGEGENYSTLEMLERIKNRKNTFLTSV